MGNSADAISCDVAPSGQLSLGSSVETTTELVESKSISILAGPPVSPIAISDSCKLLFGDFIV